MKKCTKCRKEKPLSEFRKNYMSKNGLLASCKACDRAYNRIRNDQLRREILTLLGGCCKKCKYIGVALQVDHINGGGNKERQETGYNTYYLHKAVTNDISRFQLLCANCNWEKRFDLKEHKERID